MTNIRGAVRDVQIMARAEKCEQPFLHVQVRYRERALASRAKAFRQEAWSPGRNLHREVHPSSSLTLIERRSKAP